MATQDRCCTARRQAVFCTGRLCWWRDGVGAVIAVDGAAAAFRIAVEMEGDGAGAFLFGGISMIASGQG